jgi:hypothetical protein
MVRIGYCNVDGFKGNVIGNSKVRAITRYAQKHDLDAFFGAEVNINWKKMTEVVPFRKRHPNSSLIQQIQKLGETTTRRYVQSGFRSVSFKGDRSGKRRLR